MMGTLGWSGRIALLGAFAMAVAASPKASETAPAHSRSGGAGWPPQGGDRSKPASRRASPARPSADKAAVRAPVTTDADGWPLPAIPGVAPDLRMRSGRDLFGGSSAGTGGRSDEDRTGMLGPMSDAIRTAARAAERRATERTPVPGQAPRPSPGAGMARPQRSTQGGFDNPRTTQAAPAPGGVAQQPTPTDRLDSALRQVFEAVGQPFDFAQLGGATARVRLHVHGPSGEVLATRELTHEAELGAARDRLESIDGRRVRARDGAVAFESVDGVLWHAHAAAAQAELELLGTLLRLPWSFGDGRRFVVYPRENVTLGGQPMVRLRIGPRPESEQVGPSPAPPEGTRYELWCEPTTMRPVEVRYRLHAETIERRVLLRDWRPVQGGLRVPVRRVLVDSQGRPTLEVEIVRMRLGLRFGRDRFRAPNRGR